MREYLPALSKQSPDFFHRASLAFLVGVNSYGIKPGKNGQEPSYVQIIRRLAELIASEVTQLNRSATLCYEASGIVAWPGDNDFKYNKLVSEILSERLEIEPQPSGSVRGLNEVARRRTFEYCNSIVEPGGILIFVLCTDSLHWLTTDMDRPYKCVDRRAIEMLAIEPRPVLS
jgi:hypothetical protein